MGTERKVALITGASQGIGAALVRAYRDRGYVVIATSRSITPSNDDGIVVVSGDIADRRTVSVRSPKAWPGSDASTPSLTMRGSS
jgi:NAD(P)-dependent dehydrogenase (short-subunit alcohol dehydrogenase family)